MGWQEKVAKPLMELCIITSLPGCGGSRQGTEASQDRWPGDWEHRSQMEPEEQRQPPGPSLWGRSEDCGQGPRGGGPWARGHPLTAGPFPRLPGLARAPGPAPKQEQPMPGEARSHTARPVQGQGLWGCLPGPLFVPKSRRTSSGAGKATPRAGCCCPRHPWCLQLVDTSLWPVTLAVAPWCRQARYSRRRGLVRWASAEEPPPKACRSLPRAPQGQWEFGSEASVQTHRRGLWETTSNCGSLL